MCCRIIWISGDRHKHFAFMMAMSSVMKLPSLLCVRHVDPFCSTAFKCILQPQCVAPRSLPYGKREEDKTPMNIFSPRGTSWLLCHLCLYLTSYRLFTKLLPLSDHRSFVEPWIDFGCLWHLDVSDSVNSSVNSKSLTGVSTVTKGGVA